MMKKFLAVVSVLLVLIYIYHNYRSFDSQTWQSDESSRRRMLGSVEKMLVQGTSRQQVQAWLGRPYSIAENSERYFIDLELFSANFLEVEYDSQDKLLKHQMAVWEDIF